MRRAFKWRLAIAIGSWIEEGGRGGDSRGAKIGVMAGVLLAKGSARGGCVQDCLLGAENPLGEGSQWGG